MHSIEVSNVFAAHDLPEDDVAGAAEIYEDDAEECGCLRFL
jgi:hypothetical protein